MKKPGAWVIFIILSSLVAGCTTTTTSTPIPPMVAATRIPPTASPLVATVTPPPSKPAAAVAFVDSGQKLGEERSTDVALGDLDGAGSPVNSRWARSCTDGYRLAWQP